MGSASRGADGRQRFLDQDLGFADRQLLRHDLAPQAQLRGFVRQAEERPRVPHGQCSRRNVFANLDRQPQQANDVGDGRSVLANGLGDLLLREVKLVAQPPVRRRLFHRIEILALEVLDQCRRQHADRQGCRVRQSAP